MTTRPDVTTGDQLDRIEARVYRSVTAAREELGEDYVASVSLPAPVVLALVQVARAAREICEEPLTSGTGQNVATRVISYRALRGRLGPALARLEGTPE